MKQIEYRLFVGIENVKYSTNLEDLLPLAKAAKEAGKSVELQEGKTGLNFWLYRQIGSYHYEQ